MQYATYDGCSYNAEGELKCDPKIPPTAGPGINKIKEAFASFSLDPAYISDETKATAWADRTSKGYPISTSELQSHGSEKPGWVANMPPAPAVFAEQSTSCIYNSQGMISCQK